MAVRRIEESRDLDALSARELRAVLDLVSVTSDADDLGDFALRALHGVRAIVPCDIASYNEMDPVRGSALTLAVPEETMFPEAEAILARHLNEHPVVMHYATTGDTAVRTLSDFVTQRQLHRTGLYAELYRRIGGEYLAALQLPLAAPLVVGIGCFRAGRDFAPRDRRLLGVLQPRLARAYEQVVRRVALGSLEAALEGGDGAVLLLGPSDRPWYATPRVQGVVDEWFDHRGDDLPHELTRWLDGAATTPLVREAGGRRLTARLVEARGASAIVFTETRLRADPAQLARLGLSRREADVLSLASDGRGNAEIGRLLEISPRTVKKHLESVYDKLGVRTRTAAARIALTAPAP